MPAVRSSIKVGFFLACLLTLAAAYFLNTPLPLFLTRVKQLLLSAAIIASAGGWGTRLLQTRRFKLEGLTLLEQLLFAEAAGLGALSLLMVFMGTLSAWIPVAGWGLISVGVLISEPFFQRLKRFFSSIDYVTPCPASVISPAIALWTGGVLSFILAFAPITYYDSLTYHLALPAAYLRAHHWVPLSSLIYSAFPQTMEMLWTLGRLIGDDVVVNLIGWSVSALLITAVIAFARRFIDASVGLIAAAFLVLMPAFLLLSSGGYIDVGLTFFSFMALYAACMWNETPSSNALVLTGVFAGLAMGSKYTGALPTFLLAIFFAVRLWKRQPTHVFKGLFLFAGSALLVFSPWLIKNMLFVGNPVFPFLYGLGQKTLNPWINDAAAGYFAGITEYFSRPVWTLPMVLWETAVNGLSFGRGIDVLGDYGWLPILGLLPGLWLCRERPYYIRLLMIFSMCFFALWALSRPVLRFLLPMSPLFALLAGYAWVYGVRPLSAGARWASRALIGTFLLSGLFLFFYTTLVISPFNVALGLEDRNAYLSRMLDYYSAAQFVNTQTPPNSVVYVLGDQRGYYYQRNVMITPVFSRNPLTEWANASLTPAAFRQKLQDQGITHILVNRAEFDRLQRAYPTLRFNSQGQANWSDLAAHHLTPLYHDRACDVYAL